MPGEAVGAISTIEVRELALDAQKPKIVPCRIKRIERPAPDIAVLDLRLPQNENMRYAAGQYVDMLLAGRASGEPTRSPPCPAPKA